jgi:hypothetical protein
MTTRTRRILTLMAAYVALSGLVFQVTALDHWRPTAIEGVRGVEHRDFHAEHCHGAASSCAGGASAPLWAAAAPVIVPAPPLPHLQAATGSETAPAAAPLAKLLRPPRIA